MKLKIGDTVALKSGSDAMTIESVRKDGRLMCVWFDHRHKLCRRAFPAAVLTVLPPRS